MIRRVLAIAMVFAAAPALVGRLAAAGKLNPCTVVTKAEVKEAVGQDVADPKTNPNNAAVCSFQVGLMGSVSWLVQEAAPGQTPANTMAAMKKRNIPVAEVKGMGDGAFFATMGAGMTQLNTWKGSHYLIITLIIPGSGEAKQKAIAETLMRKALAKL